MSKVNFYRRFVSYFIVFGLIISLSSGLITYYYHNTLQNDILKEKAREVFNIKINDGFNPVLINLKQTLYNIVESNILKQYIITNDPNLKENLQVMFFSISNGNKNIMQVRFLSSDGKELVRVDRDKETNKSFVVDDLKLQDKKERYYFQETALLDKNKVWFSKIDLNIENGKIEIPYKPTLRIAMPVYVDELFNGIVIINLHASELLEKLANSTVFEHFIIDKDNNYILHPDQKYSFNRYKNIKRDLSEDFPNGLDNMFLYSLNTFLPNDDKAILVLKPKDEYLQEHTVNEIKVASGTLFINLLFSLAIASILAKKPTRLQASLVKANGQLNSFNKELKQNKLFIESILDNSAHGIITSDKKGTITLFNKQAQKLLGYSDKEVVGKATPEIFHKKEEIVQKAKEYSKALNKKIEPGFEVFTAKTDAGLDNDDVWTYVSRYGIEFTVSLHMTALKDISGEVIGYMGIAEDITHQKYLSDQLEKQRNELQTILDTTKDGIAILDLETNFLYFNDAYLKMTGFTKSELLEKSCAGLSAPEDMPKAKKVLEEVLEKGSVENFEKTCILKDNKRVQINMSLAMMPDRQSILIATKDITESKKREKQLQDYVQLIDQNIITSSTDLDGVITNVSKAFCDISGYTKEELIGRKHNIIRHPDLPKSFYEDMWNTILEDKTWTGEIQNLAKDRSTYWVKASISPVYNDEHKKIGYTAIRQNITDKKIIEEISITDGLTGIYNRRHFNDLFPKIINSAKRENTLVSFLIMDIDHFKQYNDTYGHQMGDEVLIRVAGAIKGSLHRADDHCFRLGGEEFGVIFKADSKEKAYEFAELIRENIENLQIEHAGNSASSWVTASMGLISKNADGITGADELYKKGDELLYKAKSSGRNCVKVMGE